MQATSSPSSSSQQQQDVEGAAPAPSALSSRLEAATAVLWDVDGTLADSTQLGFTSTNAVLAEAGWNTITLADYEQGTRHPTPQRLAWHATGDTAAACGLVLGAAFDRHYIALVSTTTAGFYPGIPALVAAITAAGKPQTVLSNACGEYARAVVRVNGAAAHMMRVDGADDAPAPKPAPDGLLAQCRAFGWPPEACVYVGDSPSDGAAAAAAGMMSVGCTWGAHSTAQCQGAFDVLVDSPEHLAKLLLGGAWELSGAGPSELHSNT